MHLLQNFFFLCLLRTVFCLPLVNSLNDTSSGNKILGGSNCDITDAPYQVSLQIADRHICGGSIIGTRHVLTSAYCIVANQPNWNKFHVRLGSSLTDKDGQYIKVSSLFWHPDFNPQKSFDFDIGILVLEQEIVFNQFAKIVSLPIVRERVPVDTVALVTGWGLTEAWVPSLVLRKVKVPIWEPQRCTDVYGYEFHHPLMICAGSGPCLEDGGGPLVRNGIQYGIVSWSRDCVSRRYPAVYTNVAWLRDFITEYVGI